MALINCPACGGACSPQASQCPHCGQPLNRMDPPPKTWLLESILATLLCCLPFGIAGIVYASKVENYWYSGRQSEAQEAAQSARKWTMVSFFVGIAWIVIYFVLVMVGAVSGIFASGLGY